MSTQIRISEVRRLLEIVSEPYVTYTRMGYQPALNVRDVHSGEEGYLIISATSLGTALREIEMSNNGRLSGVSIVIQKESSDRMSRYLIEAAVG